MKKYQIANKDDLFWCKVDTKNGAFGIITNDFKGQYASTNMKLVKVVTSKIDVEFLQLLFKSKQYQEYLDSFITGTTNRKYISYLRLIEEVKIPLPNKEIQQKLVINYQEKINQAKDNRAKVEELEKQIEEYLTSELRIEIIEKETKSDYKYLHFTELKKLTKWKIDIETFKSHFSLIKIKEAASTISRGKSPKYKRDSRKIIINQKCVRWYNIDLNHAKAVDDLWLSGMKKEKLTKINDILINSTGEGTIGRAAIVDNANSGLLYDSHVLLTRLDPAKINPKFFLYWFNSKINQTQIDQIKSAQTTKQTELGAANLGNMKNPEVNIQIQEKIVNQIETLRKEITRLKEQAVTLEKQAIEEFEKAIFN